MWSVVCHQGFQRLLMCVVVLCLLSFGYSSFAQDGANVPPKKAAQREQELRDQLQNILDELDQLQKPEPDAPEEATTPSAIVESKESEGPEAVPEYQLADVSIVSNRVQRRPEGISLVGHTAVGDRFPADEHYEGIDGVSARVWSSVKRTGHATSAFRFADQGAKTSFAVRDIKMYEDGFIQTQSDGLSRLDLHDPWFMRSIEVTRGASSSLYDNYALGGMVHFRTRRGSDINGFETLPLRRILWLSKVCLCRGQAIRPISTSRCSPATWSEDGLSRTATITRRRSNFNFRVQNRRQSKLLFQSHHELAGYPSADPADPSTVQCRRPTGGRHQTPASATSMRCASWRNAALDRRNYRGRMYERQINANTV